MLKKEMNFLGIFLFISLLVIVVMIAAKISQLHKTGIPVIAHRSKKVGKISYLYPIFIFLTALWFAALFEQTFGNADLFIPSFLTSPVFKHPVLEAAGILFIITSVVVMGIILVHFQTSLRFGMDSNNKGPLITSGIFSVTRNPFFMSIDLYFIGQALLFTGPVFIGMAILAL